MSDDVSPEAMEFLVQFAESLGVTPPSAADVEELLDLAGAAARASVRQAAPIACWLVARAGVSPSEARALIG